MCLSNGSLRRLDNSQNLASKIAGSLEDIVSFVSVVIGTLNRACSKLLGGCDHNVQEIVSDRLYYQKDQQPMRTWFQGRYQYCDKPLCGWGKFYGETVPYKTDRADKENTNAR